jgi:internalin A
LKPKWCTDAVYKVLDDPEVKLSLGQFSHDDLVHIWSEPEYAGMQDELLQLMMKFQLCYQIPHAPNDYIAPQLLTDRQPAYEWSDGNNLVVRYSYPDFMPKGVVRLFIVAVNRLIAEQLVWKTGVVIEKDDTRAEVIEYYGRRELRVTVAGKDKKGLLSIVLYELVACNSDTGSAIHEASDRHGNEFTKFREPHRIRVRYRSHRYRPLDRIHKSYRQLRYEKLIPCNCEKCRVGEEPYFFPFDTLKRFYANRQFQIQCQKHFAMVDVLELVDDAVGRDQLLPQDEE